MEGLFSPSICYSRKENGEVCGISLWNRGDTSWTKYYFVKNLQGDVLAVYQYGSSFTKVAEYTYDSWGNVLTATGALANINPFRYRSYYRDDDTGFYYLQSRYYDPAIGRFINADRFASTGQDFLGCNMFAYCLNSPTNFMDKSGNSAAAVQWWTSTMWWLCAVDTVLPLGDIVYGVGIAILGVYALTKIEEATAPRISLEERKEEAEPEPTAEPEPPDVTYPGDDPTKAPKGTKWKGKEPQGSKEGNYHNPETDESWHPDLGHVEPIGPHWDYRDPSGAWWRIGRGNVITPK